MTRAFEPAAVARPTPRGCPRLTCRACASLAPPWTALSSALTSPFQQDERPSDGGRLGLWRLRPPFRSDRPSHGDPAVRVQPSLNRGGRVPTHDRLLVACDRSVPRLLRPCRGGRLLSSRAACRMRHLLFSRAMPEPTPFGA